MALNLQLIGANLSYLLSLSQSLGSAGRTVTIIENPDPVNRLLDQGAGAPDAAIVCLTGTENVAEVRAVFSAYPAARFLFVSNEAPPRSAMAHAIRQCGGQVVSRRESPIVIVATLVALLSAASGAA
jgi:hypothetical protein